MTAECSSLHGIYIYQLPKGSGNITDDEDERMEKPKDGEDYCEILSTAYGMAIALIELIAAVAICTRLTQDPVVPAWKENWLMGSSPDEELLAIRGCFEKQW